MSESIIADFVGSFNSQKSARAEPVKGRILLSRKRLVLAAQEGKTQIPLSSIFDVAVGQVPDDLGDFFNSTVTVAFERNDQQFVAAIEADDETIEKFNTVLFKALLNGTDATVKHPARIGGRVTGAEFTPAKLFMEPRQIRLKRPDGEFTIRLATVTGFERLSREISGATRPVLAATHNSNGQAVVTLAALPSSRKMNILGRYLRREYREVMDEIRDIDLSKPEKELLVSVYSTGEMDGIPLAKVLDMETSEVELLRGQLEKKDLLIDGEDGLQLTPAGRVVVNNHLEDVND
ncbi:CheF family chemotaxis protein [Halapricum desulfuricans]|uniref:Taxis protein CheF n=1 Tax=Halapricum desulfuricans TaxID=2841257 RepID=A0A897NYD8_9EURY|nr:CheF family chemotaxis protein [Halapricum desulfuricans]QSG15753.1 Component of chemotaxis system associated with archaellum, contains CheF-like and HTH domain [Halapricum desulfuricans]